MGIHDGHRQRLVNKAIKDGFEKLEEHEIVELLLFNSIPRGNTNEIAHRLLDKFKSLRNICAADVSALTEIEGVGTKTADFLKLLPLYVRAYELSCFDNKTKFDNPKIIGEYCSHLFYNAAVEKVYMLYLTNNKRIIKTSLLCEGDVNSVNVNVKEIVAESINLNASYVVMTHNHLTGLLFPSQNDITFTNMLKDYLNKIDVKLLDHIIVTDDRYYSFWGESKF